MAAFRDDDRWFKGGGEVVSALAQHMRQRIWDCLRDDNISVFSVWGWQGVGKSRIVRQVVAAMEESGESSRLFDVIIRVRAPGIESLGEKMPDIIKGELEPGIKSLGEKMLDRIKGESESGIESLAEKMPDIIKGELEPGIGSLGEKMLDRIKGELESGIESLGEKMPDIIKGELEPGIKSLGEKMLDRIKGELESGIESLAEKMLDIIKGELEPGIGSLGEKMLDRIKGELESGIESLGEKMPDIIKGELKLVIESLAEKMPDRIKGELERGIESLEEKMLDIIKGELKLNIYRFFDSEYILKKLAVKGRRNRLMELQMGIQKALEIPESAKSINDKLSGQTFLLIFEDVWESFDLKEIGVPITSGSKVVITTQSDEVCSKMGAQLKIKVEEWSEEDAWDFLQEEMADVASSIGFSNRDMVFKCFSYVSLFCQNGSSIDRDSLVEEYWRSEGFLDRFFNEEENKAVVFKRLGNILLKEFAKRCMVLLSLTSSNPNYPTLFLEETQRLHIDLWDNHPKEAEFMNWLQEQFTMEESSGGQYHVDMNSHVRQVIGSRTFLVKNNLDAEEACQWISLSHNQVQTFQFSSPNCPLLSTLLLNDNDRLQEIPNSFFKNMTRLRVLDLSSTSISSLPLSMSCLSELRLLKLQSCCKLEALPAFLKDMQNLEILNLHQTPLTKMVEVSFHNMQTLQRLDISGACNLSRLSLKGCRSLVRLVSPDKLSKLEALDLSGTKLEELPHEIFNLTSMRCLDLLGMEHLKTVDWRKIDQLPEILNWDRCGLNLLHEQLQDSSRRHISVSDASVFESLDESSKLWKSCFLKFHFLVCPCEGGRKDRYVHFKRNRFFYQHIYTRFEPSLSYERRLEVCGGKNSLEGVRGVLSVTEFFHLYGNAFIKALSNLGMEMNNLKECWIEKCHQMEYLFITGMDNNDAAICLENLRVSNLAKLITVCQGKLGRGSFACLKHIYLECCPKLINFFSSRIQLQNLKLLEIKFCCRLEKVFEEDSEVGQNAFPQLVDLCLWELRKLKRICSGHLPMLKKLKIRGCPLLENLPLDNTNASATEVKIQGEMKWWENIKWEGSIKPSYIRFKEWYLSKIYRPEVMVDDDDGRLRRRGEIVNAGHKRRQIPESDRAEETAASRDGDDGRLRQGGEVVSAWSRRMRQQIWDCLRDDNISVFSVWGWQGVGKSRIMRQVVAAVMDESGESSRLFDVIIRVRAPGVESLAKKMQQRLGEELKHLTRWRVDLLKAMDEKGRRNRLMEVQMGMKEALDIPKSMDFSAAAKQISAKLSGQRFLLVLEDVWESINLKEMGVPVMASAITSGSKVVITTQSQKVCKKMKAQVNIKVGEWSKEDAWDFLQEEAADVAASIGFSITRDMVFKCFSYVSLLCGNRCSIDADSLIEEYWRSEGLLDGSFNEEDNKEAAFKRLENVLLKELAERCMVLLSLVSSNPNYLRSFLVRWDEYYTADISKMQSMEEEFMDWLREQFTMEGSSGGQYHVDMNSQVMEAIGSQTFPMKYSLDREESCRWISLSNNPVETLPFHSPNCPLLSTLLLKNNDRLQEIPDVFFQNMTKLRVLDISFTSITFLPSSMSCLCELRLLKLRSCCKLEALPAFLKDMQKLEILDLHQTPLTKMVEVSFHNMQSLRRLNISSACNLIWLSLKGCRSLVRLVCPDKLSKLEALDLSGTKLEELPHKIFNLTSLRCLDLLGMEHLKTVDWRKIDRLPENLNWDRCGLDLLHEQLQDRSIRRISVSDASVFKSLDRSSKLWKSCFLKFHFVVCTCKGGHKDRYGRFKGNRFLYHRIYAQFEQSLIYDRCLEVCGGKNSLDGVRGVLSVTKFFHLYGNVFIKALSNLGMEMDNLKECWIEKCHQLELLFVGRMVDIDAAVCLENLRVSNLAKLITVCRGKLGRGSFACLKHIYLECCPKLINFFSSSIQLQNLKVLEIKFCCRLEKVFEEDSMVGQNAFPQLVDLRLWELRKLKSICGGHLPMLKKLKIRGCPMLEKLPLHNTNASAAEVKIEGELKWWESIKWEGSIKPHNIRFKEWRPSTK